MNVVALALLILAVGGSHAAVSPPYFEDCPVSLTVEVPAGQTATTFAWAVKAKTGAGAVLLNFVSVLTLPLGEHVVDEVAVDPAAPTAPVSCNFVVTVIDPVATPPAVLCPSDAVITLPADSVVGTGISQTLLLKGLVAMLVFRDDAAPTNGSASILIAASKDSVWHSRLSLLQTPEVMPLGRSAASLEVRNRADDSLLTVCRIVVVVTDASGPSVTCPSTEISGAVAVAGGRAATVTVSLAAADAASGVASLAVSANGTRLWQTARRAAPPATLTAAPQLSLALAGGSRRTLQFEATDALGNVQTCSFTVALAPADSLLAALADWLALLSVDPASAPTVARVALAALPDDRALDATELALVADLLAALVEAARTTAYAVTDDSGVASLPALLFELLDAAAVAVGAADATVRAAADQHSGTTAAVRAAFERFAGDYAVLSAGLVAAGAAALPALQGRVLAVGVGYGLSSAVATLGQSAVAFTGNRSTVDVPAAVLAACVGSPSSSLLVPVAVAEYADARLFRTSAFSFATRVAVPLLPRCAIGADVTAALRNTPALVSLDVAAGVRALLVDGAARLACTAYDDSAAVTAGEDVWTAGGVSLAGSSTAAGAAASVTTGCSASRLAPVAVVAAAGAQAVYVTPAPVVVGTPFHPFTVVVVLLSALLLLVVIAVHLFDAQLRYMHMSYLVMNTGVALAVSFGVYIASALVQARDEPCRGIAVGAHYFWLASMFWLLADAVYLYRSIVVGRDHDTSIGFYKYFFAAWLAPVIIVGATMLAGLNNYADSDVCWIRNRTANVLAFWVPLALVFLTAGVLLFRASRIVLSGSQMQTYQQEVSRTGLTTHLRSVVALYFQLLMAWIVGSIARTSDYSELWQYLYAGFVAALAITYAASRWLLDARVAHVRAGGVIKKERIAKAEVAVLRTMHRPMHDPGPSSDSPPIRAPAVDPSTPPAQPGSHEKMVFRESATTPYGGAAAGGSVARSGNTYNVKRQQQQQVAAGTPLGTSTTRARAPTNFDKPAAPVAPRAPVAPTQPAASYEETDTDNWEFTQQRQQRPVKALQGMDGQLDVSTDPHHRQGGLTRGQFSSFNEGVVMHDSGRGLASFRGNNMEEETA